MSEMSSQNQNPDPSHSVPPQHFQAPDGYFDSIQFTTLKDEELQARLASSEQDIARNAIEAGKITDELVKAEGKYVVDSHIAHNNAQTLGGRRVTDPHTERPENTQVPGDTWTRRRILAPFMGRLSNNKGASGKNAEVIAAGAKAPEVSDLSTGQKIKLAFAASRERAQRARQTQARSAEALTTAGSSVGKQSKIGSAAAQLDAELKLMQAANRGDISPDDYIRLRKQIKSSDFITIPPTPADFLAARRDGRPDPTGTIINTRVVVPASSVKAAQRKEIAGAAWNNAMTPAIGKFDEKVRKHAIGDIEERAWIINNKMDESASIITELERRGVTVDVPLRKELHLAGPYTPPTAEELERTAAEKAAADKKARRESLPKPIPKYERPQAADAWEDTLDYLAAVSEENASALSRGMTPANTYDDAGGSHSIYAVKDGYAHTREDSAGKQTTELYTYQGFIKHHLKNSAFRVRLAEEIDDTSKHPLSQTELDTHVSRVMDQHVQQQVKALIEAGVVQHMTTYDDLKITASTERIRQIRDASKQESEAEKARDEERQAAKAARYAAKNPGGKPGPRSGNKVSYLKGVPELDDEPAPSGEDFEYSGLVGPADIMAMHDYYENEIRSRKDDKLGELGLGKDNLLPNEVFAEVRNETRDEAIRHILGDEFPEEDYAAIHRDMWNYSESLKNADK